MAVYFICYRKTNKANKKIFLQLQQNVIMFIPDEHKDGQMDMNTWKCINSSD